MFEDKRWRRLLRPGITVIVGAGGKTTVLERLGTYGHSSNLPIMVSSTVPMDSERVDNVEPFDVICTDDFAKGEDFCASRIAEGHVPAWFKGLDDKDRYIGLDPQTIDKLKQRHPAWYILVECDESKHKWLKAPSLMTCPCLMTAIWSLVSSIYKCSAMPLSRKRSKASKRHRSLWTGPLAQ